MKTSLFAGCAAMKSLLRALVSVADDAAITVQSLIGEGSRS